MQHASTGKRYKSMSSVGKMLSGAEVSFGGILSIPTLAALFWLANKQGLKLEQRAKEAAEQQQKPSQTPKEEASS